MLRLRPLSVPFAYRPAEPPRVAEHRRARALVAGSVGDLARLIAEAAAGPQRDCLLGEEPFPAPPPEPGAPDDRVLAWLGRRLDQLEAAGRYTSADSLYAGLHDGLERQPDALALMLWNRAGERLRRHLGTLDGGTTDPAPFVVQRLGAAAVPGLVRLLEADPVRGLERFADVEAAEIAPVAARALVGDDGLGRRRALSWLLRHLEAAATGLLPAALGADGTAREEAGHALRRLAASSPARATAVDDAVARYAAVEPRAAAAAAAMLHRDPLLDRPRSVPSLPGWFVPANLRRPVLIAGGALPDAAVRRVGEMLAASNREDVHPGLAALQRCCTADSLGAFASDLFSTWLARGGPGQDPWAVRAMGWLGDDGCVPRLAAQIRRWLDLEARPQAAMGIEALADLGTDAALNRLAALAERLGSKSLRAKAARHLAEAAEIRGLAPEALADRVAPDLGLDARGGLDLDLGARRFRAELDGDLKPVLRDASGRVLKDLPRPGTSGDPERAAAAAAWTALKRDARGAAGPQLARLEAMLASGRRVAPDVFRSWFANHPLVGRPARRLLWTQDLSDLGGIPLAFTVSDEGALVDADGAAVELEDGDGATVGLAHPLDLSPDALAAWRGRFERLGLTQPFPQLDRDVHRLSAAERDATALHRVRDVRVEAGWLRGMMARGWPFGRPEEEGLMWWIERGIPLADGSPAAVRLAFAPGLCIGTPEPDEGPRALSTLDLLVPAPGGRWIPAAFGRLAPVVASELIRSVTTLAGRGAHPTAAEWGADASATVTVQ